MPVDNSPFEEVTPGFHPVRASRALQDDEPPAPSRPPIQWPRLRMPKRASLLLALKWGTLVLGVLLLAVLCWWWLRPKTLTFQYLTLLDNRANNMTTVDTHFGPAGIFIEQTHAGMNAYNYNLSSPLIYTLLGWDGKQRWQVESPEFEQLAKLPALVSVQFTNPTTGGTVKQLQPNPELSRYTRRQAISPDGRMLVEAQVVFAVAHPPALA